MKKKIQQVLENKTSADQDLFALLGLAGLTTEEQQTLLASLSDIVFQGVFAEAIPRIPEDKLAEFTKLTGGKGNEVEVFEFLETILHNHIFWQRGSQDRQNKYLILDKAILMPEELILREPKFLREAARIAQEY
jgi:hypothetical protein